MISDSGRPPAGSATGGAAATTGLDSEAFVAAQTLITTRQSVLPKRLFAPAPSPAQLDALLALAAAAPDHGQLTPWRFIAVPSAERHRLGEVFAQALLDRDASATLEQVAAARDKADRAPLLMVVVACLGPREPDIPAAERLLALGAAVQNLLLGAHALGFAAGLTSGQAMSSPRLARLCGLSPDELVVCCINIGTATARRPSRRPRPQPAASFSELRPAD